MTVAVTMEELLGWNEESSSFWKSHLDANPAVLELPCGIGGAPAVLDLVRHIWAVELRWAQRIANVPELPRESVPIGPLDALYKLHNQAMDVFRSLIDDPAQDWEAIKTIDYEWLPPNARHASRRKLFAHALFHSQRHWAQLATLVRAAGLPSGFKGDLLFTAALR
jgi:uncharacterized damage-inducible protein DinB